MNCRGWRALSFSSWQYWKHNNLCHMWPLVTAVCIIIRTVGPFGILSSGVTTGICHKAICQLAGLHRKWTKSTFLVSITCNLHLSQMSKYVTLRNVIWSMPVWTAYHDPNVGERVKAKPINFQSKGALLVPLNYEQIDTVHVAPIITGAFWPT